MIYDCFIYNNESELLEIRLEELENQVDKFVIVESNITFSGAKKNITLDTSSALYEKHRDKIIHILVDNMPQNPNPWIKETYQRNAMLKGLNSAKPNDIVIFSDADEIPRVDVIEKKISNRDISLLEQDFYYYKFNLYRGKWSKACTSLFKNFCVSPQEARTLFSAPIIKESGWHFSYLMDEIQISEKIESFSHQEFNTEENRDPALIKEKIEQRLDLFGRNKKMEVTEFDNSFPDYLTKNREKFKRFII
ncbi:hypothetical protein AVL56_17285 [Alteromonas stellipolaris]|uniref:hypothetical protein n=1 Tax=Alteromonas stellipolaris TaxID=233316 RepID=UPI00076FF8BF|nr:hypothetical protein [Alteromonas stellipolaris]AMJ95888.1 hypothetical protein AVL56_17285 [Alteromonas stellipolaris]